MPEHRIDSMREATIPWTAQKQCRDDKPMRHDNNPEIQETIDKSRANEKQIDTYVVQPAGRLRGPGVLPNFAGESRITVGRVRLR